MITRFLDEPARDEARHVDLGLGAAIVAIIALWTWGRWPALAWVLGVHGGLALVRLVLDATVARTWGPSRRAARAIAGHAIIAACGPLFGWALPMWLWMPYTAVAHRDATERTRVVLVSVVVAMYVAAAWIAGTSLSVPAMLAAFAFVAWYSREARETTVRSIVASLESQRDEIASAHSELGAIHEQLAEQIEAREHAESELREAQKLEAIGRLAAGVAHEINTPMQFIGNSLEFISEGTTELLALATALAGPSSGPRNEIGYLSEELPNAIDMSLQGVQRVAAIVRSMKQVSHRGVAGTPAPVDVNATITSALTISAHEYKLVAELVTELSSVPTITLDCGELCQVLINLIVNAAHSVGDVVRVTQKLGTIRVRSLVERDGVAIYISDTGAGIPDAIRSKIFDSFFTTKPVGKGSGQGLAIARAMIEGAGGHLSFDSEVGVGTTFCIWLPSEVSAMPAQACARAG